MTNNTSITVKVLEADLNDLERMWYEYNAARDIIGFLMTQKNVVWDTLQEYINIAEKRFTVCEMMKAKVANKFLPDGLVLANCDYSFDFVNLNIVYTPVVVA